MAGAAPLRFLSLEELKERAKATGQIDNGRPLRLYFRTADLMLAEAKSYERDGDKEKQYISLNRFAVLVLQQIPTHKEYKPISAENKAMKDRVVANVKDVMSTLETLRDQLKEMYAAAAAEREREAAAAQIPVYTPPTPSAPPVEDGSPPPASASAPHEPLSSTPITIGTSYSGFQARQQATAPPRRTTAAASGGIAAPSSGPTLYPTTAVIPAVSSVSAYVPNDEQRVFVQRKLEEEREQMIMQIREQQRQIEIQQKQLEEQSRQLAAAKGTMAQQEQARAFQLYQEQLRLREDEQRMIAAQEQARRDAVRQTEVARTLTETPATLRRRAPSVTGDPMRNVVIWNAMLSAFLTEAHPKTVDNKEFCGILAGVLHQDVLYVNTLIIPKQESTSDTVSTVNEEELYDYQITRDLLTLGWIHTHPTQDCFMSSVDLHTHCGYQTMLPEAIAIVMAPSRNPNYGIFHMTLPDGLRMIQNCDKRGFHPHPGHVTIYEHCTHVMVAGSRHELKLVDLRGRAPVEKVIPF